MARPTLFTHRKLRKLAQRLQSKALAIGSLEMIWHVANESGNPVLGDLDDVEAAAEWRGERGELVAALMECGTAGGGAGFIVQRADGLYEIHDYWHHAPDYVSHRRGREAERSREKYCEACNGSFFSADPRALYCSSSCRVKAHRNRQAETDVTEPETDVTEVVTERNGSDNRLTDCNGTPAPNTQHPTPAPVKDSVETSSGRGKGISSRTLGGKSNLSTENPRSPPQDARSFDVIKQNVASIAERFKTNDPERIYALGARSYKLSKKQCSAAVKQLREDGFFDAMRIVGAGAAKR